MDFFTMKRKKLQTLCKKHGVPANLKNIEMAQKLSLIYKEKENENPESRRLRTVKDKSNVEIIILDSDSDTEVQMEAPEIVAVAEKDSNEMNNVNVEHFLDELPASGLKNSGEPDQFLVTSPLSEVKSSDVNIRHMVDSDTVAEKDSNEKTNVDELESSGLKYCIGEPDQFLVTSPLSEMKSSDINIHHMVDSGTSGGNADVNEVKSASSQQMSRGQEESQMKLQGEKSQDNVKSVYLEEYKQMSFIKEKIEENQELYHATPADLNVHHMVDSGTAFGHVDACEVISESLQTTSQGLEMSTMKLTPERNDNVRPFYVENMQMSLNVLEQFGNFMMMREESDWTPVQFLPTSHLNIHKMAVKGTAGENADVSEMKSASSQQMKFPSERSDYNVGSFNLEENKEISGDKVQIEDNQELYAATPSDPNVHLMVDSDTVAEKDSNGKNNVDEVHSSEVKSSDHNIHHMGDSDTVAEKDSNEKTNVDELESSGLKYSIGEPDQFLVTSPLSEVKSSDINIHHMVDSGTSGGNADVNEVKSASSQQMSRGQEESQMKLQGEKSQDNVKSVYLEEYKQMSFIKEKIEENQELYHATPADVNVHHMVDSGTAFGHVDACEVISESLQTTSQGLEMSTMKLTPERNDNVIPFYVENMQMSLNVLEQFGNFMMMREESDWTPVQFLPTSHLNIHKMAVKGTAGENADVSEMKSASSQQMKFPSERSDYNVGSFNLEENKEISGDKAQIEDNQELYAATPSNPNVHLMVDSDTVAEKDSNGKNNVDEVHSSEVKSSDHNIHHMGDSGTVAGIADACEVKSASLQQTSQAQEEPKMKLQCERSENNVGSFYLEENIQMSDNKEHIEDNQELSLATPTDLDVLHMVDSGTAAGHAAAAGHADGCEVNSASLQGREEAKMKPTPERSDNVGSFYVEENMYISVNTEQIEDKLELNQDGFEVNSTSLQGREEAKMKLTPERSDNVGTFYVEENIYISVNTEQIEDKLELNQAEPSEYVKVLEEFGNYMMMGKDSDGTPVHFLPNSDLNMQGIVFRDTASGDEDAYKTKLNSPSKVLPIASEEKNIIFSPKLHDSSMVHKEMEIETSLPLKGERDSIGTCEEEMLKLSEKARMVEDPEEIRFSPNELEASTTKGSEADTYFDQTTLSKLFDNSDVGGVGVEDENHSSITSTKRKRSDVVDTNSDEEVKADELVPTASQSSEMMSCTFSLQQLFASDVCEVKSSSQQLKFPSERSDYNVGSFNLEENKQMGGDKVQIEDNQELYAATPSDPNVHLMVDSGTVAGIADACEVKSASLQQTSQAQEEPKMKLLCERSENNVGSFYLEENIQMSDNKEHIEDNQELSPATPTDLDVLPMVDSDTASGDEDAYKTKLNSPSMVLPIASEEKNIIFSPKLHDSSMVHNEMEIETSLPMKGERDSIGTCEEEEMLKLSEKAYMVEDPEGEEECIRISSNELEASTTKGSEADKYFEQTTLSKLFDNSDVGGVEDEIHSSTTSTKRKRSDVVDTNSDEEVKADELVPTVSQSSEMRSCTFSLQQLFASDTCEEEMLNLSEKEKTCMVADLEACIGFLPNDLEAATTNGSHDEDDTSANSDEDVKADELVPTVPQPSEMESCNFGLQQLFAADTASGEEVAYKTNLDSPSKATPIASGEKSMIFSPKLEMSLPQKRERDNSIETSLPQKHERENSIATCDMKENINIDKKEEVGSIMSKTKFAKRQPLQDLQQN